MNILQPFIAKTGLIVKGIMRVVGTGAIAFPMGTTAERPPMEDGLVRFNTQLLVWEKSVSGAWVPEVSVADVTALIATQATEWLASGLTPTYISTTSFSVPGDRTATFVVGRRVKTTNTAGTRYSRITASSFASTITTITVVSDSGTLDSGITALFFGILNSVNSSFPASLAIQTPVLTQPTIVNPEYTEQILTDAATTAWNMNNGHIAKWTITATGRVLGTPTNYKVGGQYQILIRLTTPSTMTPTMPSIFKFQYDILPDFTTSSYTLMTMTWSTEHTKFLVTVGPGF